MRKEIKHEAEEKAVPHDESASYDASTDSDDAIKRRYRGVVWIALGHYRHEDPWLAPLSGYGLRG
jgi:hypothetical protein